MADKIIIPSITPEKPAVLPLSESTEPAVVRPSTTSVQTAASTPVQSRAPTVVSSSAVASSTAVSSARVVPSSTVVPSSAAPAPATTSAEPTTSDPPEIVSTSTANLAASASVSRASAASVASVASAAAASSAAASSAAAAAAAENNNDGGLSSIARSLIIAATVVGCVFALILAIGFLLRRRRSRTRDAKTVELNGIGEGAIEGHHDEKDWESERGDIRFKAALGRAERPNQTPIAPQFYQTYNPSDISLQASPMNVEQHGAGGGWRVGGFDANAYPGYGGQPYQSVPQQQQYFPPSAMHHPQSPYSAPTPGMSRDPFSTTSSLYVPNASGAASEIQRPQSTSHRGSFMSFEGSSRGAAEAQAAAAASIGGNPALGGALAPGGAFDPTGVEMRVVRGFQATMDDELPVVVFSSLMLHQTYDDGWCLCSNASGRRGVVPRDCLSEPQNLNRAAAFLPRQQTPTLPQVPAGAATVDASSTDLPAYHELPPSAAGVDFVRAADRKAAHLHNGGVSASATPPPAGQGSSTDQATTLMAAASASSAALVPSFPNDFGLPKPHNEYRDSLSPSLRRSSLMASARAAGLYLDATAHQH